TEEVRVSEPQRTAQHREKEETTAQTNSKSEVKRAPTGPKPAPSRVQESSSNQNPGRAAHQTQVAPAEPSVTPTNPAVVRHERLEAVEHISESEDGARIPRKVGFESAARSLRQTEIQAQPPSPAKEFGKENIDMSNKWLDTAFKRQKQEAPNGNSNGT